jgi:hypothetical protein
MIDDDDQDIVDNKRTATMKNMAGHAEGKRGRRHQ